MGRGTICKRTSIHMLSDESPIDLPSCFSGRNDAAATVLTERVSGSFEYFYGKSSRPPIPCTMKSGRST